MRALIITALVLLATPLSLGAQTPRSLPLVSADLALGFSRHSDRSGEVYYTNTLRSIVRISGAVRVGTKGRIRPVALVDYSGPLFTPGTDAICIFAPDGHTCREDADDYRGLSLGLGGRALIGRLLTVGVAVGTAFYEKRGTYFQTELTVQPGRHIGFVLSARHVELHHPAPGRLWLRPMTFGLRIQ